MTEVLPDKEKTDETPGELAFQIFCAVVFLTMIGLVFSNSVLRYVFRSSFTPSEEWSRILFIYITFFGAIEAFYRGKHIAVDMLVCHLHGVTRKSIDIVAQLLSLGVMFLLSVGGISMVYQTIDTYTVATGLNMAFVNGTLPCMAIVVFVLHCRDLWRTIQKPASEFKKTEARID